MMGEFEDAKEELKQYFSGRRKRIQGWIAKMEYLRQQVMRTEEGKTRSQLRILFTALAAIFREIKEENNNLEKVLFSYTSTARALDQKITNSSSSVLAVIKDLPTMKEMHERIAKLESEQQKREPMFKGIASYIRKLRKQEKTRKKRKLDLSYIG